MISHALIGTNAFCRRLEEDIPKPFLLGRSWQMECPCSLRRHGRQREDLQRIGKRNAS